MNALPIDELQKIMEFISAPCGRGPSASPSICPACLDIGLKKAYRLGFSDGMTHEEQKWRGLIDSKAHER